MKNIVTKARKAARGLSILSTAEKDRILLAMAKGIDSAADWIKKANAEDVERAGKSGKNSAFIDRLKLDAERIDGISRMIRKVAELKDPIGEVLERLERPNGLVIEKVRVPIGVIGIIYESRPNVTADCTALCFKSGNAVILRGGSDAISSNKAIYNAMKEAASAAGLTEDAFILVEDTSRELVDDMLNSSGGIDLIMPRGGESLIRQVVEKSRVPVIKHYKGICHVYVDEHADLSMAEEICYNAKVQRPGVCNAMETMLVHESVAAFFLPRVFKKLSEAGVTLKGDTAARKILGSKSIVEATEDDFHTEYLDLVLNIRVVDSLDEAVDHIAEFGTDHSDAIVTENEKNALEFTKRVDSAAVYVNASTRFTDGGEFGKGAEIGIATGKLHARGPMGLSELTTYKYVVTGTGQVRE
ncbi:MAG: glutamate-5-semialdehyde dehydrogenase [Candidatus Omnitrophica bacterium]|nr:glutamate-5-semialdehyde dehydrogenase [Candidatus Omnitrophota bacterium]MBU1127510.1 glutamate-5-semialdehyde dehydrogenase [Candidatus Omnitrophota bacterium]MBU1783802.1 glutamate-5-semialdehyde dehydrogenase [Candidatus Omnitrophota bacterium]MBU1851421.1 glutamate-5-semialdehyde dehydrogenase [Candidatus Omnitrophota bacterium]